MKVMFLQNIDGIAGSENYFLALIPALKASGVEVEICCVVKKSNEDKARPFIKLLLDHSIKHQVIKCSSYGSPLIPYKINSIIKEAKTDILHCHLIYADFWGAFIKQFLNSTVKVISTKHGYHETTYVKYCTKPKFVPKNLYYYLFKWSHKRMDASYACSYGLKNFYSLAGLINAKEMQVIQHGFDYPKFIGDKNEPFRFSKNQLIITGRLIERKGHHFILEVMPKLISTLPDIVLVVLGSGLLEKELKAKVKQYDIQKNVKFLGFQTDVPQFLNDSDIMLMTSYSEGLPLVIFESFNAKTPVITFDTIGSNELVINGKTGIVVPAFDTNQLAIEIIELLTNTAKATEMALKAYKLLKSEFSLDRMTIETIRFYQLTLN